MALDVIPIFRQYHPKFFDNISLVLDFDEEFSSKLSIRNSAQIIYILRRTLCELLDILVSAHLSLRPLLPALSIKRLFSGEIVKFSTRADD